MASSPKTSKNGGDESPPTPPPSPSSKKSLPPSSSSPLPKSPAPSPPTPTSNQNSPPSPPTVVPPQQSRPLSPASSSNGSPSESNGKSSPSNSDVRLIVGLTVGLGMFLIIFIVTCVCCAKKKRKRQQDMQYYDPKKGNYYYNNGPNWQNGPKSDHVVNVLPPGAMGPGHMWGAPSPSIQMMNSSDMSSEYSAVRPPPPLPPASPGLPLGINKSSFTFEELAAATNGFSPANLLGQGGFGYVYKGIFPNGKAIAVKQLKSGSGQGEREFQAEVEIISRVHHRHLVSLEGYCISGEHRILVYEFVPNNTLDYHLHGNGCPTMDWPTRHKIALGSAKGLAYLHEDCHPKIIHRDIKTSNILLDYNFEAMVADFGLAKLASDNRTHVSTRVMGTFGYLAPEYASSGKLTEKSDVFSFGVMLLELITGRRPVDHVHSHTDDTLVDWARPIISRALEDGDYSELVEPRLQNNYNQDEMARMAACAAASVRHSSKRRPKMSQIVRALEGDVSLEDLNEGVKPGQSSLFGSDGGDYENRSYDADMKRFRKMAFGSQDFTSSQFSDYGHSASESDNSREMKLNNNNNNNNNKRGSQF